MKKIILVIFLALPSISYASNNPQFENSNGGVYGMCSGSSFYFIKCVNDVLDEGEYQLYGYPFRADNGAATSQAFIKK